MMKNLIHPVLILMSVLTSTAGAEEVIYAVVGEKVILKTQGDASQHYMHWYFKKESRLLLAWINPHGGKSIIADEPWKAKLSLSGNSLTITGIKDELFGTFVCEGTAGGKDVFSITYKVIKLSVSMNPASPLLPTEPFSLECNVGIPQGQNKPDIHWLNPQGEKMSNQGTFTRKATSQDNGSWTCAVKNKKNATISVTVMDLAPGPLVQYTSLNTPLTILCSIPSHLTWEQIKQKGIQEVQWHFFPKPSSTPTSDKQQRLFSLSLEDPLTWKADQNKGLRPVSDIMKGNLSLTKTRGKEEDGGNYRCSMTFKNDVTLSRTVHVKVLQIISSAGTEIISGQQVNLSCSTGEPLPSDMQLKWFPPEKSSLPRSDHHHAHLTIKEVGAGDGGKWRCELRQRDVRLTSAEIILKIEPKVSMWMLVIIGSAAVILILLLILVFILCRRRQRKMRHLRHRLCQCKHPKPKGFYRS